MNADPPDANPPNPPPSTRGRFWIVRMLASTAAIFGLLWLCVDLLLPPPDLAKASQKAAELQAILRQQPQFAEVRVVAFTTGKLNVSAPDELSPAAKTELEQLVARHSPDRDTPVIYFKPVPADAGAPPPK